ncbi:MAG: restriction endonuclease, SacI family [Nitrospinota bacterium]
MGKPVDYGTAQRILGEEFGSAEIDFQHDSPITIPPRIINATKRLFESPTQSFREALVGCALVRIMDQTINIRLPYMNQGENAFNGRTLDERVVNPFLQDHSVPCSKGPYLNVLRRGFRFVPDPPHKVRHTDAYAAFLEFIHELENVGPESARRYLRFLLYEFVALRDASQVTLYQIRRLSLEQYEILIGRLLQTPSGGLLPVLLAVAMFETIRQCFALDWEIDWQGINVSDRAAGVGGDITIKQNGEVILAVEITERTIDRDRVVSTFNAKISPQGIDDYLFFFSTAVPTEDARAAGRQYFAQGHDISFLPVKNWLVNSLGTIGPRCRGVFTNVFLSLLENRDVPSTLKVAWNDEVRALLAGTGSN